MTAILIVCALGVAVFLSGFVAGRVFRPPVARPTDEQLARMTESVKEARMMGTGAAEPNPDPLPVPGRCEFRSNKRRCKNVAVGGSFCQEHGGEA